MKNNIPEKFANEDGTLNNDALLKSYQELEKKIGAKGPDIPDEYPDDPMFADVPGVKEKFREIGLSAKQAESLYALAAEFLSPAVDKIMTSHNESAAMKELCEFFGGDEKTIAVLNEINEFAEKNLSPEAFDALASSADGIKAIYDMMSSKEPAIAAGAGATDKPDDGALRQMMRDPKYWRDHDPEFVRKIESGFRKLYK